MYDRDTLKANIKFQGVSMVQGAITEVYYTVDWLTTEYRANAINPTLRDKWYVCQRCGKEFDTLPDGDERCPDCGARNQSGTPHNSMIMCNDLNVDTEAEALEFILNTEMSNLGRARKRVEDII